MRLAEEGKQMMFAEGKELDVFDDDHLVVVDIEERAVEDCGNVLGVAAREEGHGFFHAFRRIEQAVARGIFADAQQQFAIEFLCCERGGGGFGCREWAHGWLAFRGCLRGGLRRRAHRVFK